MTQETLGDIKEFDNKVCKQASESNQDSDRIAYLMTYIEHIESQAKSICWWGIG